MQTQYVVTLIYADGTKWVAGGFPDLITANNWVLEQQASSSWVETTVVNIDTITD